MSSSPPPVAAAQPILARPTRKRRRADLGRQLLRSRAHINNAPVLLARLSCALSSGVATSSESVQEALLSLHAFFLPLLRSGELSPLVGKRARELLSGRDGEFVASGEVAAKDAARNEDGEEAKAIYECWLWEKYDEFVQLLLKFITRDEAEQAIQTAAMDALMEFTREESQGKFSNRIYNKVCLTMVQSKGFNSILLGLLASKYFVYPDICYYTCINLEKIIATCLMKSNKGYKIPSNNVTTTEESIYSSMCNIYDILMQLDFPRWGSKASNSTNPVQECSEPGAGGKAYNQSNTSQLDSNLQEKHSHKEIKKMRSVMSKVWLSFLRLPLPSVIYMKVLSQLHTMVIPCMTNPILLSDFLTNSYDIGGIVSVMALNGLFVLITQHGLEYPDFYNKLYKLLEPSIFMAKYRSRFFELLDTCLKSSHLPSYVAAGFAKKLGRLALLSPPSGSLIVIAMIHNLLRRHPSINFLVHWDSGNLENVQPGINVDLNQEQANGALEPEKKSKRLEGRFGVDPYIADETDTAKCNAIESSLWEVQSLRRHYCPAVSRFIASLEADLTVRAKTMELAIKDFSSGSYATIFTEEISRRMKQVPLAFYKSMPSTLFPSSSSDSQLTGEVDFPGWVFAIGKDNQENRKTEKLDSCIIGMDNLDKVTCTKNGYTRRKSDSEGNGHIPL